jgi:predicted N-acyltransferase
MAALDAGKYTSIRSTPVPSRTADVGRLPRCRWKAELAGSIAELPSAEWDALDPTGHPFVRHAFLASLESAGCVGGDSGWMPQHLVVRDTGGALVAAVPQYLKSHSWGEFIFDMSWAQGYMRSGLDYYPKLLSAIPFTPVTGPRLLVRPDVEANGLRDSLAELLIESARTTGASGAHVNFTTAEDQAALERAGFLRRHDCRFQWRNAGYRDFDDFIARFRADKRKKARRERRRVAESGSCSTRCTERTWTTAVRIVFRILGAHIPAARQRALPERRFPAAGVAPVAARSW